MRRIVTDSLTDPRVLDLLGIHVAAARQHGNCNSLRAEGLKAPLITVWTIWEDDTLLGMVALKRLGADHSEIKSMHVAEAARGKGAGAALLTHVIAAADSEGMSRLSLETGSSDYFAASRALYRKHGFLPCGPFGDYPADSNSVFMTMDLRKS